MSENALLDALYQQLFADPDPTTRIYAVLDGASVPNLPQSLTAQQIEHICLYRGELEPDLAQAAPYLALLQPNTPFTDWILKEGWGNHWGIFATARADMHAMRKHFRTFIMVYDSEAKPLYFRYYDPRVLRVYLPTCNAQETRIIFGPVMRYIVEDKNPNLLLKFWNDQGRLQSEQSLLVQANPKI